MFEAVYVFSGTTPVPDDETWDVMDIRVDERADKPPYTAFTAYDQGAPDDIVVHLPLVAALSGDAYHEALKRCPEAFTKAQEHAKDVF